MMHRQLIVCDQYQVFWQRGFRLRVIGKMPADVLLTMQYETHTCRTEMDMMLCLTRANLQAESTENMYAA